MNYCPISINAAEYQKFKTWLYNIAGIDLKETKIKLVEGRLACRLKYYQLESYTAYFKMISSPNEIAEAQMAIDLLTTNETYFFREPKHFEFLKNKLLTDSTKRSNFRLWCAASSTGEEPYTLAMTLAESLGTTPWQIVASDINLQVLEKARSGHYALERAHNISKNLLQKYCLKGSGSQQGTFLIQQVLRDKIQFKQINLINALPDIGKFDVIFLRNVMIYFDRETRIHVVNKIFDLLKPGGYLFVSHSESLVGINNRLKIVQPSIFIKS
ncbi:CheR family methyltransferase [Psychromonas antarctica]|uniref:CheR family methyltransferase n=1 Tax=Psychromonas antarctica TaxID=67573 RepID=UPI001EE99106|nr:CheR family methyltransferase [Psychromonas antarctica]MCG6202086.1 methyltransferase domain-containing protein [Psychromonas antarctica]